MTDIGLARVLLLRAIRVKDRWSYDGYGQFTYTAADGAFGAEVFEYTITDDDGDASTATVYLTIDARQRFVDETVGPAGRS